MAQGRWRDAVDSGPQTGLGSFGVVVGAGLTYLAWHAAHSNWRNGYVLMSPSKDAHLHAFGWWLLPLGLGLFGGSLVLAISGFRRARPRWVLGVTAAIVFAGLGGLAFAVVHYSSLSAVCTCDGG
jgi:hypothetical protein